MRTVISLLLLLLLSATKIFTANIYIRDGASGSGVDWNNALDDLPSDLNRGDTYYLADGTYADYTFDDVESGTTVITIKKATASDHGTETGWLSSYGDGQAFFNGTWLFGRDYYVIDGQVRNESNWADGASYGFRSTGVYIANLNLPPGGDNITIRYSDIGGTYSETFVSGQGEAVYLAGFAEIIDDITIHRCFLHNWSIIQGAGVSGLVVEYTLFAHGWSKEAIRGQVQFDDGIIRHNVFWNSSQTNPEDPTSGCTAEIGVWAEGGPYDNNQVYGNVIYNTITQHHSDACIFFGGEPGPDANNNKVYNNTIAGISSGQAVVKFGGGGGSGNFAYNNLWYDCGANTGVLGGTASNNGEETSDPFVNYGAANFHLDAAIAGVNPGGGFDAVDRDGITRGADGTWDRGAFEFDSGGSGPIGAPGARKIGRGSKIRMVR